MTVEGRSSLEFILEIYILYVCKELLKISDAASQHLDSSVLSSLRGIVSTCMVRSS